MEKTIEAKLAGFAETQQEKWKATIVGALEGVGGDSQADSKPSPTKIDKKALAAILSRAKNM